MENGVTFEDDNEVANIRIVPGAPTGMIAWLIKKQVVKNGKQAEQFLMWLAIGAVILGIIIYGLNFWSLPNPGSTRPLGPPIQTATATSTST